MNHSTGLLSIMLIIIYSILTFAFNLCISSALLWSSTISSSRRWTTTTRLWTTTTTRWRATLASSRRWTTFSPSLSWTCSSLSWTCSSLSWSSTSLSLLTGHHSFSLRRQHSLSLRGQLTSKTSNFTHSLIFQSSGVHTCHTWWSHAHKRSFVSRSEFFQFIEELGRGSTIDIGLCFRLCFCLCL